MAGPDLDQWLRDPSVRVVHARGTEHADQQRLWQAALSIRLDQTRLLGRLIRWRIPGVPAQSSFQELFTQQPFCLLQAEGFTLLSGLVGRIWTLRRDYPELGGPDEYRRWNRSGTAKVLFANWVQDSRRGGASLHSETRVQAYGAQGRLGLAGVRPFIATFNNLVATDAMAAALREVERG